LRARVTPAASLVTMRSALEWRSHIPNYLTFARVGAVPVLIASFYVERSAAARVPAALFGAIALTDCLDGYLARRWKVESELGAFLDPVADKFLVCTALVVLSGALSLILALARTLAPAGSP
jgi:CDP-diacylglycerol--glycerol-3-phosphate 3-phosphatidyltransferase